jgi:hypothetical protein
MFEIHSFAAALRMPGSENILELTLIADTEAEAREMIADQMPDEVIIVGLYPIASNLVIDIE